MDPLAFLFSLERLGMKFGLENMTRICAALGHPERQFRSVIVAGTNGKGSVTAMTAMALHAAGHRSARYTSPHLERLEERFVIGEAEVATADLAAAAGRVQQVVEGLVRDGGLETLPTFFECATAIAFELFRRAGVDVAVIEVGLGGRLDATNVITPMAAAITSIAFDHQDLLGPTLASIAREKAGVIKPGVPVVVGPVPAEARAVIDEVCRAQGARLIDVEATVQISATLDEDGRTKATLRSGETTLVDVPLALRGRHQVQNAAVALGLMDTLQALGVRLDRDAMIAGLTHARWPGRLERRPWRGADVLLDAAHNPAGAEVLATYLRDIGWTAITLVVGAMRDKDVTGILAVLLPLCARVICTTPPSPRALAADALAALARTLPGAPSQVLALPDPTDAMADACQPGARVVAAGSIFLLGPLRGILR